MICNKPVLTSGGKSSDNISFGDDVVPALVARGLLEVGALLHLLEEVEDVPHRGLVGVCSPGGQALHQLLGHGLHLLLLLLLGPGRLLLGWLRGGFCSREGAQEVVGGVAVADPGACAAGPGGGEAKGQEEGGGQDGSSGGGGGCLHGWWWVGR